MRGKKLTRREFLAALGTAVGGGILIEAGRRVSAQFSSPKFLPLVSDEAKLDPTTTPTITNTPVPTATKTPRPTRTPTNVPTAPPIPGLPPLPAQSIVSHVRHASVTNWNGTANYYYNHVDQGKVNAMLLAGLRDLTGFQGEDDIWNTLFTRISAGGYQSGQRVAIKVNFNCASLDGNNCQVHNNLVDTLPQIVLSLVESMNRVGVPYNAMDIYDATAHGKPFYEYFRTRFSGKAVRFVGDGTCGIGQSTYGKDNSLNVRFDSVHRNNGLQDRWLTDTLFDATYLINIPILKGHGPGNTDTGFTAAFKNHLGSIEYVNPGDQSPDNLHNHIYVGKPYYSSSGENPLVTIYKNPHIGGKAILTVMDGLFGGAAHTWSHHATPTWDVFGNQPANSLFFALDAVALDCVAADIVHSESGTAWYDSENPKGTHVGPYDFLKHAAAAGLGRYESRYPYVDGQDKYTTIVYNRINLS